MRDEGPYKVIGEIIRKRREEVGMTQLELSDRLGYQSPQFVSLFERGLSKVPIETLGELSTILNISEKTFTTILLKNYEKELKRRMRMKKRGSPE